MERGDGWSPATLSLWAGLEPLFAFTYSGLHAEALARGRDWFDAPRWPPLTLWWTEGETRPDWAEGVARMEHLHRHGPTARAFTFKQAFDAEGRPVRMVKGRVVGAG